MVQELRQAAASLVPGSEQGTVLQPGSRQAVLLAEDRRLVEDQVVFKISVWGRVRCRC
jgi:hypothetical protein